MRWLSCVTIALAGCSSVLGIDDFKLGDAGTTGGDGVDASSLCFGPPGYVVCLPETPTNPPITLDATGAFDTNTSQLCAQMLPQSWRDAAQPDACFLISTRVTISAAVNFIGSRPLVILGTEAVTITGVLDAASHVMLRGPGSPSGLCVAGQPPGTQQTAGGGAGGSFMTLGGDGGAGSSGGAAGGRAGTITTAAPPKLRAGCPGAAGGLIGTLSGTAGQGGGAVYLVSGGTITINGAINVSGAGGGGAASPSGGGGGGTGGMVLLHAPLITGTGVVMANGGGGGGGGVGGTTGAGGGDPQPSMFDVPANGGMGGGPGGAGFAGATAARNGANGTPTAASGGGGGGGGAGYIRANMALMVRVSPTPDVVP